LVLALAGVVLAGCGGQAKPRGGAEPAHSPAASQPPAGRSVPVGLSPEGIVADGKTGLVAVATRNPAQIVLLSERRGRVIARVSIPGAPRHLQLARPGGPVLVPEEPVRRLLELSLPDGRFRSIAVGVLPHDATEDHGRVFVGNEFGRSVSVIDGTTVVRQIGGFVQPGGLAAVGRAVAIVDVGADTLTLVDARSLKLSGRVSAGAGPTHVVAGTNGRIYVIDTRGDAVLTYATRPRLRRLSSIHLAGRPYGVASDSARDRVWVTLTATNQLAELDVSHTQPRVAGIYATGRQPDTVAVDPSNGRVFVANASAGTVQIINPGRCTAPRSLVREQARSSQGTGRLRRELRGKPF